MTTNRDRIVDYFRANRGATVFPITVSNSLDLPASSVRREMQDLHADGVLLRPYKGEYMLPVEQVPVDASLDHMANEGGQDLHVD